MKELKRVRIKFEDLQKYKEDILNRSKAVSLYEFINLQNLEDIILDFSDIKFDANHKIDLTGANFSGCDFSNLVFNGKYVIVRNVDFTGANLESASFTDNISLEGAKLGSRLISEDIFKKCDLSKAYYDPTESHVAMIKATDQQIDKYLELRKQNVLVAQNSFNEYLASILKHKYQDNVTIIADLSGRTIDSTFSGADLSGSNLEKCQFIGEINNLNLQNCHMRDTSFEDCKLTDSDLRGCNLSTGTNFQPPAEAIKCNSYTIFTRVKLSVSNNIQKAVEREILPQYAKFTDSIFDPCYQYGSKKDIAIFQYEKCSRDDVLKYRSHCNELVTRNLPIPSFKEFINESENTDFIPDLSNLDFRNIDLSNLNFENTNFSFSLLNGCNLNNSNLSKCNLSGTDLSKKFFGLWQSAAKLNNTILDESNLTCADLSGVGAQNAHFNRVIAFNVTAEAINLSNAEAKSANFSNAWLWRVNAQKLQAQKANFSYAYSSRGNYSEANLNGANMSYADFRKCNFYGANMEHANLFQANISRSNLTRANLRSARLAAEANETILYETNLENADLAGLFYENETQPIIENTDTSKALESVEKHRLEKAKIEAEMQRNKNRIYTGYAVGLAIIGMVALIALSIFSPPAAAGLVVATLYSSFSMVATTAVGISVTGLLIDSTVKNALGFDFGITKTIANVFGADKVVKVRNHNLQQKLNQVESSIKDYSEQNLQITEFESEIIRDDTEQIAKDRQAIQDLDFIKKIAVQNSHIPDGQATTVSKDAKEISAPNDLSKAELEARKKEQSNSELMRERG